MSVSRFINIRGALFTTGFAFGGVGLIRLASSLTLTRILTPAAFGVIAVLMSVVFVVEMLGDIGIKAYIVRQKNGDNPLYLNTAWTLHFLRACVNFLFLLISAPLIAEWFYHLPDLATPLRVFSLYFLIGGLESMAFPLAVRHKKVHIVNYLELAITAASTVFAITYCHFSRDYWGMLWSILLGRLLYTIASYCFYRESRPRLTWDPDVARDIFRFTRITAPSSLLTLGTNQFDKFIFLRIFDLPLLGMYGVAGGIVGPIEGLIARISQTVLYPRCTFNFRTDPASFLAKYYSQNIAVFIAILGIPAAIAGAASLVIHVIYPTRYAGVSAILQALMLRATVLGLCSPAEEMLVAAGQTRVMLVGNILRMTWTIAGSLTGYYFFGFTGFIYGIALNGVLPLLYFYSRQHKSHLIVWRYEAYKIMFAVAVGSLSFATSSLILTTFTLPSRG